MTRAPHPSGPTFVRIRNYATAALLTGGLMALAACGSGNSSEDTGKDPATRTSTPAATSSADPEATAKVQLLDAYRHYWDEKTAAYAKASMSGTKLEAYAKGDALGLAQSDLKNLKTSGQVTTGKPRIDPQVTSLDLQKKVPLAEITDCVDVSAWKVLDAKTKSEVALPKNRRTKYVSNVTAERWGKRWIVLDVKPEDRAC
ncbi:hypothetical protein ACGFWD_40040 [Streptomyces sp. NPDC048448]|uniref:hypothetical protein n=1 Tax=Streptomyces sp. NPDC048448 TaxID=3365554 RepID=UPI003711B261